MYDEDSPDRQNLTATLCLSAFVTLAGVYLLVWSPSDPLSVTVVGLSLPTESFYIVPGVVGMAYSLFRIIVKLSGR